MKLLQKIKQKVKNKDGFNIGDMLPLGMTIVTVGIALSLGLTVLSDFKDSQTVDSNAYNGTANAEEGLTKFTNYLPTISLVVVVSIIIGIIVNYMFFRNR